MGAIRAVIAVLVVLVAAYAVVLILAEGRTQKGACGVASNIILPHGGTQDVPCCGDGSGGCLPGLEASLGSVALIPSKLSKGCPVQLLSASEAAPAFVAPSDDGTPGTVNTDYLGRQYKNKGCGGIQVGLTRYCAWPGADVSSCTGGIAAVESGRSVTVACPAGGSVKEMRRTLFPSDLGNLSESCSYEELGVASAPAPQVTLDPKKDADEGVCAGHPLTEALFYQCVKNEPPSEEN